MFKDYYDVLGVPSTSTGRDIRAAYKKLALQFHPDRTVGIGDLAATQHVHDERGGAERGTVPPLGTTSSRYQALEHDILFGGTSSLTKAASGGASSTTQFTEIQEAYEVLSDVARRYLYDLNYQELLDQQRRLHEELEYQRQAYLARQQARDQQAAAEREQARERERQRLLEQQARLDAANTALHNIAVSFSMLQATPGPRTEGVEPAAASETTSEPAAAAHNSSSRGATHTTTATQRVPTPPPPLQKRADHHHASRQAPGASVTGSSTVSEGVSTHTSTAAALPKDDASYYQRSIQRTMEVFFAKELEDARSAFRST